MIPHLAESNYTSAWHLLGAVGSILFYSRFCVQWFVSERRGESTIPVAFWYLSAAGSLSLLAYAIITRSPIGALGQCFNIVVYTRNLIFIWRSRGKLNPVVGYLLQFVAGMIALSAIAFVVFIWLGEYNINKTVAPEIARQTWIWLAVGVTGQLLFAGRFLLQWIATERRGESTVPPSFWYLSVAASILQAACFLQRQEWLFFIGMALTIFIYLRNIALLKTTAAKAPGTT